MLSTSCRPSGCFVCFAGGCISAAVEGLHVLRQHSGQAYRAQLEHVRRIQSARGCYHCGMLRVTRVRFMILDLSNRVVVSKGCGISVPCSRDAVIFPSLPSCEKQPDSHDCPVSSPERCEAQRYSATSCRRRYIFPDRSTRLIYEVRLSIAAALSCAP